MLASYAEVWICTRKKLSVQGSRTSILRAEKDHTFLTNTRVSELMERKAHKDMQISLIENCVLITNQLHHFKIPIKLIEIV